MTTPNKANEFEHFGEPEPALALGRLIDVDTKLGTATLDNFMGRQTPLRFDPSLGSGNAPSGGQARKGPGQRLD